MKIQKDTRFFTEMEQYDLRLTCEECVHYNAPENRCSLLWPNTDHLKTSVHNPEKEYIIFCKEFDLN